MVLNLPQVLPVSLPNFHTSSPSSAVEKSSTIGFGGLKKGGAEGSCNRADRYQSKAFSKFGCLLTWLTLLRGTLTKAQSSEHPDEAIRNPEEANTLP